MFNICIYFLKKRWGGYGDSEIAIAIPLSKRAATGVR